MKLVAVRLVDRDRCRLDELFALHRLPSSAFEVVGTSKLPRP